MLLGIVYIAWERSLSHDTTTSAWVGTLHDCVKEVGI